MKILRKIFKILVYIFAALGFIFVAVYFAVKFHLTDTSGIIDNQFIQGVGYVLPGNTEANYSTTTPPWVNDPEYQALKVSISKDANIITGVSAITGVPARLIVMPLFVEQMRLYYSERETFKQFFQPLNILGAQSQFSWGIMGFKEMTAEEIENDLKNPTSPDYLGVQYAHLLDFDSTDPINISIDRFQRLTSSTDHYYSYLYAALYIKEIETQWKAAGFDISKRPEIIATLYNIGFDHSKPNANPQVGGAEIDIDAFKYSFGGLGGQFYYSNELTNLFPKT